MLKPDCAFSVNQTAVRVHVGVLVLQKKLVLGHSLEKITLNNTWVVFTIQSGTVYIMAAGNDSSRLLWILGAASAAKVSIAGLRERLILQSTFKMAKQ
jgi:hypothetical protein